MHDRATYDLWERLYTLIDSSPDRFPVHTWKEYPRKQHSHFLPMDIWPIIKSQVLLRLTNYFHTETGPARVLLPDDVKAKPTSPFIHKGASIAANAPGKPSASYLDYLKTHGERTNNLRTGRAARSWPRYNSDVLFFASRMCNYPVGDYLVQNHIDPYRLALESQQVTTATLMLDVNAGDPSLERALLGGTYGFGEEFLAARASYPKPDLFNFAALPGFSDWLDEISELFPLEAITSREIISRTIRQTYSSYMIFRDYLHLNGVQAVYIYAYYGIAGWALSHACREIDIPIVDIQHGVAGAPHESYSWPGAPVGGYSSLPTDFFAWTEEEAEDINASLLDDGPTAYVTGHSWRLIDAILTDSTAKHQLVSDERFSRACDAYGQLKSMTDKALSPEDADTRNILICLYTNEPLEWLETVIDRAPDAWNFYVRLHPGEAMNQDLMTARKEELKHLDVEIEISTRLPIPLLMPHMDAIVNKYSSIVRDASAYGVPSICYSLSSEWYHNPNRFDGVTIVEQTADDIFEGIEERLANPCRPQSPAAMSHKELAGLMLHIMRQSPLTKDRALEKVSSK